MLFSLFLAAAALAQTAEPAAKFQGGQVSVRELDEYIAWKYGRREEGQAASKHLMERSLVEREAESRGLRIAQEVPAQKLAETQAALGPGGLERELQEKQLSREEFLSLLTVSLLHQRMTREDLGLRAEETPSAEQLQLWIADRAKKNPDIPAPTAQALGRTIRTLIGRKNAKSAVLDLVGTRLLEGRAHEAGFSLSEKEIEEEIAKRRARVSANPRYEGLSFEELLKTQGLTPEDLRQSPGLRASMLLERLARASWPAERLATEYRKEKDRYDGMHGESRRVSWILIRGLKAPNQLVRRNLEDAAREAEALRSRISSFEDFQRIAKIYSEDEKSKAQGGEIGFIRRREPQIDAAILGAIFDAKSNSLAGPIQISGGAALLWVGETKPAPAESEILERIFEEKRAAYYEEMVRTAKVTTFLD